MDPTTLDPRKNGDVITSTFLYMLYDGLTRLRSSGEVELSLAESVQASPDGLTYEFRLRKALWSDGNPITAHDFEFSWKGILDPSFPAPCKQLFFPILNAEAASEGKLPLDAVGIESLDELTLRVSLAHPMPHFLSLVSFCNFYPVPRHLAATNLPKNPFATPLATSGPFSLSRWERGKEIALQKNPLFWDANNVEISNIHISIVGNEFAVLDLFEGDALDWISSTLSPLSPASLISYREDARFTSTPIGATVFTAFNTERFPFHNQNIRKAFSHAIDRNEIVGQVTRMGELPAHSLVPPVLDPNGIRFAYDLKLARTLLRKGLFELNILEEEDSPLNGEDWKVRSFLNNLTLSFTHDDGQFHRDLAQSLQHQWSRVLGFRIKLILQPYKMLLEQINNRDFNIVLRYCMANFSDPLNILERFKYKHLARNYSRYESAEYIGLLNRAQRTQDLEERSENLRKAEARLLEDCPLFPIHHIQYPVLSKPAVTGVEVTPVGSVHFRRAKEASSLSAGTKAAVS
jgi:oligopeptide transport system substrate-binding protein